ncbi:uncharacterized protein LOC110678194, partial [Aedes aegypti]|uniref:Uncharacterized protein n=1 Tax=Aedes aegypti TaxID=7159 RepID=A0A6I8TN33_AEDAE
HKFFFRSKLFDRKNRSKKAGVSDSAAEDDEFNITGISHRIKTTTASGTSTSRVVRNNPLYGENFKRFVAGGESLGAISFGASASNKSVIGGLRTVEGSSVSGARRGNNEFGENVNAILTDLDEELEVRNWRYQLSNDHF